MYLCIKKQENEYSDSFDQTPDGYILAYTVDLAVNTLEMLCLTCNCSICIRAPLPVQVVQCVLSHPFESLSSFHIQYNQQHKSKSNVCCSYRVICCPAMTRYIRDRESVCTKRKFKLFKLQASGSVSRNNYKILDKCSSPRWYAKYPPRSHDEILPTL